MISPMAIYIIVSKPPLNYTKKRSLISNPYLPPRFFRRGMSIFRFLTEPGADRDGTEGVHALIDQRHCQVELISRSKAPRILPERPFESSMGLGILHAYETRTMDAFRLSSERPPVMALRNENRSEKPRPEECVLPYFGEGRPSSIHFSIMDGWRK
jgi:hypothetical protein